MQKKSATSDKTQDSGKEGKTAEKRYSIRPSTSNDWIMLTDLETGLEVDVELRVLDYCYDCVPKMEYYAPPQKDATVLFYLLLYRMLCITRRNR